MTDPLPPDQGRPPSPEDYERLRRAHDELRQTHEVRSELQRRAKDNDRGALQKYLRYTGLGLQFLFTLGLPIAGGWALDNALGLLPRTPVFLIAGSILGMVAAMWSVVRAVSRMEGEDKK